MAASWPGLVLTLSGYYWMARATPSTPPLRSACRKPPPELVALADLNLEQGRGLDAGRKRDAGVKIALGSDMEVSVALEIQRMIFHGLTPAETLVAATRTAAQALDLGEHVGTVAEGMLAELADRRG